ncbi:MAG: type VII secretion protein EccCa [Actinomycetota bacterium]
MALTTGTPAAPQPEVGRGRRRVRVSVRTPPPHVVPSGDLVLAPPPTITQPHMGGPMSVLQYALPAVGSLGSLVFILANPRPIYILGAGLFAVTAIAIGVGLGLQQRTAHRVRLHRDRARYLEYLDRVRAELEDAARAQDEVGHWLHPAPRSLSALVAAAPERVWERRRGDEDFGLVRMGVGEVPLARTPRLDLPDSPLSEVDSVSLEAAERLVARSGALPHQPLAVPLPVVSSINVIGPPIRCRALARAAVAQCATWHAPRDLRFVVAIDGDTAAEWTWVKWLPHVEHPDENDIVGRARMFSADLDELVALIGAELEERQRVMRQAGAASSPAAGMHIVVVVDRPGRGGLVGIPPLDALLEQPRGLGVTVLRLVGEESEAAPPDLRIVLDDWGHIEFQASDLAGERVAGEADSLSETGAESLARSVSGMRLSTPAAPLDDSLPLQEMLGFDPLNIDAQRLWRSRPGPDLFRVPIGVDPDAGPVILDLKESALGGMGPHGLIVGATGSGKSELLRTLVAALSATHPPEQLNFVLVDFKGGATFAGLGELPHVAGSITNLSEDLALVDRMHDALYGEMQRRQELLRSAGDYASLKDYDGARSAGAPLDALPSLLVIVDEFSELLTSKPDFIDMFVAIGRVGRSLGIHLLLASQRLDEGRLRGLESHLSYRIGLRTFSAADSRAVLGVPDAYELPSLPGSGYLKYETGTLKRFRAAYVSAPVGSESDSVEVRGILPFTAANVHPPERPAASFDGIAGDEQTVLDVIVTALAHEGSPSHQVWLPPLDVPPTLDHLVSGVEVDPLRGLRATRWPGPAAMKTPIGIVDKPREQKRELLIADLSGALGHVAIVGGPRSGKTTLSATLVASLAVTHTPEEVQVYGLDLGGGGLAALAPLPHVGTIATRLEPELVRRLIAEVALFLQEREQRFRHLGIDSAGTMRRMRAAGELADERLGDVLLVIDGWPLFRTEFEDLEKVVIDIATRGLGYGVHLVLTTNRWFDFKPALKDALGTRLELRLGDPVESEADRKVAANVPAERAGRGLTPDALHFLGALPRIDGVPVADGLGDAMGRLATQSADGWPGPTAAPVRVLPPRIFVSDLPPAPADTPGVPVGVGELDFAQVLLDLDGSDPHFLVFGDGGSGKTSFLRTFLRGLERRFSPDEARVIVVDYRRTLLGAIGTDHLLAYAGAAPALDDVVADLHGSLERRLPGTDVTPGQLTSRSWWSGPHAYLVIDDYDLVITPSGNPLAPLVELLPQARDIGFHVVLARRVGGVSRAFFEPFLQRLKDLGTPAAHPVGRP